MERLPADDVVEALAEVFEPGVRVVDGQKMYSSAFLNDRTRRPDELEVRRRQREIDEMYGARKAGRR
jgi:hypothetical protein